MICLPLLCSNNTVVAQRLKILKFRPWFASGKLATKEPGRQECSKTILSFDKNQISKNYIRERSNLR